MSSVAPCTLPSPVVPLRRGIGEIKGVAPASRLAARSQPQTLPTGIAAVDALTGGLPRGALTEVFGPASSGRTSLLLAALASATARQETCALVDTSDAFDPQSAAAAGVDLKRVLWVRCGANLPQRCRDAEKIGSLTIESLTNSTAPRGRLFVNGSMSKSSIPKLRAEASCVDQALRAADLLLHAGGFGLVVVDLADVPAELARRVPLTSWFRFRRAVENTPAALLLITRESCAKTCASLVVKMQQLAISSWHLATTAPAHGRVMRGMKCGVEVVHSRMQHRKGPHTATWENRALWAG